MILSRCGNCIRLRSERDELAAQFEEREEIVRLAVEYRRKLKATGRAGAAEYMAFVRAVDAEIARREAAETIDQRTEAG